MDEKDKAELAKIGRSVYSLSATLDTKNLQTIKIALAQACQAISEICSILAKK